MKIANTFAMGIPDLSTSGVSLLAVLVADSLGGVAAYTGLVKFVNEPNGDAAPYMAERKAFAEDIARRGMKLNYRQALGYFPHIAERDYRR